MPLLKYYDTVTSQWLPILAGAKGDTGDVGPTGPQGPAGLGSVAVNAPITNSGTSTAANLGINYSAFQYGQNAIINGAFDIWQRGTSFTGTAAANGTYQADRFNAENNSTTGLTISRQAFTPGAAPVAGYEGNFFLRYAVTTASSIHGINQKIEDIRTLAGQTVTLSFWAKAAAATTLTAIISHNYGTGGSGPVDAGNGSFSVTTSWQRFSLTIANPSIAGKTIGANSFLNVRLLNLTNTVFTLDIWGVQLEAGSVATPFKRNGSSLQGELAACQRYFVSFPIGALPITNPYFTVALSGGGQFPLTSLPVPMRTTPTSITNSAGATSIVYRYLNTSAGAAITRNVNFTGIGSFSIAGNYDGAGRNGGATLPTNYVIGESTQIIFVDAEL
jgi:hypothetical protein